MRDQGEGRELNQEYFIASSLYSAFCLLPSAFAFISFFHSPIIAEHKKSGNARKNSPVSRECISEMTTVQSPAITLRTINSIFPGKCLSISYPIRSLRTLPTQKTIVTAGLFAIARIFVWSISGSTVAWPHDRFNFPKMTADRATRKVQNPFALTNAQMS
jgi:hypothetical protein